MFYLLDLIPIPSPNFLSDIASFEIVILAFLVPLSIDIVSKISERYKSDSIINLFQKPWQIKYMPIILLINIVFAIALRFLVNEDDKSLFWKIASLIIFLFFIFVVYIVHYSIKRVYNFMISTNNIINLLYESGEKALEK